MSLGSWGDLVFEVSADRMRTFREAKRSGKARMAKQDVINGKPVKSFIGPDLDSFSLSITLDAMRGVVPADELRDLREQRDIGAVHPLILGEDLVFDATLDGLSEDQRRFDGKGRLVFAIVELTFEEYA